MQRCMRSACTWQSGFMAVLKGDAQAQKRMRGNDGVGVLPDGQAGANGLALLRHDGPGVGGGRG